MRQGVLVRARWDRHNTADFRRMISGEEVLSLTTYIESDVDFLPFLAQ